MTSPASIPTPGIATAAASVREVAPPAPIALELDNLVDQLGALEVTVSALTQRLNPVLRELTGPTPGLEARDVDETRSDVSRRIEAIAAGVNAVRRHVDSLVDRLEV